VHYWIPNIQSTNAGTFIPKNFRSRERKFHRVELSLPGTTVPWNFCSLELSLPGTKVLWNFRSLELSLAGTFVPFHELSLLELIFLIGLTTVKYTRTTMSLLRPLTQSCHSAIYYFVVVRRRRYRVASGGRSVALRWPRLVARLQRSAGGIPLSFRTW